MDKEYNEEHLKSIMDDMKSAIDLENLYSTEATQATTAQTEFSFEDVIKSIDESRKQRNKNLFDSLKGVYILVGSEDAKNKFINTLADEIDGDMELLDFKIVSYLDKEMYFVKKSWFNDIGLF